MSIVETLALAVLQGLTEFLPVSSSGHLVLAQRLFGTLTSNALSYILVLHLATAFAALVFYRREVAGILRCLFPPYRNPSAGQSESRRLILLMALASVVTTVVGLTFRDFFEGLFDSPRGVSPSLFVTGALLFLASRCPPGGHDLHRTSWWKAMLIGLAQAAAIIPGLSRSGSTIAVGIFLGLRRETAVKFSFLLSLVAIPGAAILEAERLAFLGSGNLIKYGLGFAAAAAAGYLAMLLVMKWASGNRLWYFAVYCWLLSAAAAAGGWLS
jgi:undecaprenyl-diphosphatase